MIFEVFLSLNGYDSIHTDISQGLDKSMIRICYGMVQNAEELHHFQNSFLFCYFFNGERLQFGSCSGYLL